MKSAKSIIIIFVICFFISSCSDLYLGKVYYTKGEYEKSYDELKHLVKKGFPEASYYIGRKIEDKKIENKSDEDCIEYYKRSFEQGYLPAASRLGFFYLKKENYQKSLKWLKIASDNGDFKAKAALIKLKLKLGNNDEKNKIMEMLDNLSVNSHEALLLQGEIYEKGYLGYIDFEKAKQFYKQAYLKGNINAGLKYGNLLAKTENEYNAIEIYTEIYEKENLSIAAFELGKIYEKQAKNLRLYFCPATKANTPEEYYSLKKEGLSAKKDLFSKALDWYKKANDLPKAQYRMERIKWYLEEKRCGDYKIIKKYIERNVSEAIKDYIKLYQSGSCSTNEMTTGSFITQDKQIKTVSFAQDNETLKKNTLKYYLKIARHYEFEKLNIKKAKEFYKQACYFINPESELALARLNQDNNTDISAAIYYYYAMKDDPKAMYLLGLLYFDLNQSDKAVYWLKKSVKTRFFPALKALIDYYFENEDNNVVVKYLESLTDIYPCFVNIKLGEIFEGGYDLKPNLDKAKMYYERALVLKCPEAYYRLAWHYFYNRFSEKNLEKAKDLIEEYILIIKDEKPKAYRLLGRIYRKLGNKEKAIKYLFKATKQGYTITTDEVRFLLTKYKKIENIYPADSGGKALVYLSEFIFKRDIKASLCFAYKAAKENVDRGGLLLLKIGSRITSKSDLIFLNRIKNNPKICDNYINKIYTQKN
jgi:TPR repeat protein